MGDSVDKLSEVTGVKRADMLSIMAQVKANQARLHTCARHQFEPQGDATRLGARYRCTACGGEVDASAARWYALGHEHSKAAQ